MQNPDDVPTEAGPAVGVFFRLDLLLEVARFSAMGIGVLELHCHFRRRNIVGCYGMWVDLVRHGGADGRNAPKVP